MNKPVFDIVSEDLELVEWQNCRLVMEVGNLYFHYVVLSDNRTVVALKFYQFTLKQDQETAAVLEEIIKEDLILKERMRECILICNFPKNCLVPDEYYHADLNSEMLHVLHGDLGQGVMYSDKIEAWNIQNIYRVPNDINEFFKRNFHCSKILHLYSSWLGCRHPESAGPSGEVTAIFYPNEIITVVFAGGQLQLMQAFSYKTAEDIAWHLLNIYKQFNLDQSATALTIGGMIAEHSAMYQELLKYFLIVSRYPLPSDLQTTEQLKSFPEHFFSPLLKLAACE